MVREGQMAVAIRSASPVEHAARNDDESPLAVAVAASEKSANLLQKCAVDPSAVQLGTLTKLNLVSPSWSEASWSHPAMQNLKGLSELSRWDLEHVPGFASLQPPEPKPSHQIEVQHEEAAQLRNLSAEANEIPRNEFVDVDPLTNFRGARCVSDAVHIPHSEAIAEMKQLVCLSDLTTRDDPHLQELVGVVVDRFCKDTSVTHLVAQSNVHFKIPRRSDVSVLNAMQNRNRGFQDSDVVTYPKFVEREAEPQSIHDCGYETWMQKHLDGGCVDEPADRLERYQDELTSIDAKLRAMNERLAFCTETSTPAQRREAQLRLCGSPGSRSPSK